MELLNNRFRIIKRLNQNNLFTSYLVNDLWEDNIVIQLNILNPLNVSKSIIDYYSDEFLGFINYNNDYIVNNHNFNVVSYIDNKKVNKEQYFYTCEYIDESIHLLDYIKNKSVSEIIELFVELCKIFHLIHIKGHVYESINTNNIYIIKKDNNYFLKIKDIATKELERRSYLAENYIIPFFVSPINYNSRKNDIYSLNALLLALLKEDCDFSYSPQHELADFYQKISQNIYQKYNQKDIDLINKLELFFNKVFTLNDDFPYQSLTQLIQDLNKSLGTDYQFIYQEGLIKVNYHLKIIGRDKEVNKILDNYDDMINYNPFTKVFLLKGEMGTGKTRILEEIKFRLELRKANLYYSFSLTSLNESSDKMWVDILRKLILDNDSEIIQKYEPELMKFFPEIVERNTQVVKEYIEEHQTRYRLLNRIAGFISESINNKPTVFIIDNIDLANDFTLDTFTYLYTELVKNRNIIFIFSYNESNIYKNKKFADFISNINKNHDCKTMNITNLNSHQSGEMIRSILDISYIPVKLTEKIYSQSYGNPLFISEVIKDLYNREILYPNNKTGYWYLDIPDDDDDYKLLIIPNSIEQTVLNQIKDLDEICKEILSMMSIFPNSISIDTLNSFMEISDINFHLQELTRKGIISKVIGTSENLYTINNKVLKDIVYERIPHEEKINKHIMVANKFENESENMINYEDLIYHFECAKNSEKVIKYSLKYAEKMHEMKNFADEVKHLRKALSFIQDNNEKISLLIKISSLYYELGNDNEAILFLVEAEKHANNTNDYKQLIDLNLYLGNIALNTNNYEECRKRLRYSQNLLKNYDNLESHLECQHLEANVYLHEKKFEECAQLLWKIIDKSKQNYPKIEADCYRLLAYIYSRGNKISEALNLYNKALNLFELSNHIRGILICLNNIGTIYSDIYQNEEKALEYYYRVKDISDEYGAEIYGVVALINIACHYEISYDYESSYIHFKQSLDKSLKGKFVRQIFFLYHMLTKTCLNLNYFTEAYNYNNLAQEMITKSSNQGLDIIEFYKSSGDLYYTFGDFKKAQEYVIKSIEFYKSGVNYEQFQYIIQSRIINLRLKPIGSYEDDIIEILLTSKKFISTEMKISSLSNAAIVLGERKDYKNAHLLLNEIKESLPNNIHDITLTKYYIALGINDTSEKQLDYYIKANNLAKKQKNKLLLADTIILIGDYYFNKKEYLNSVNYYLEVWEILKYLIEDIPNNYKLSFVNSYKYAKVYFRIKYIYNLIVGVTIFNNEEFNQLQNKYLVNNLDELRDIISDDVINKFKNNKEFMEFISSQFTNKLPKQKFEIIDIISNISNDTISNIELVINYLASITLATNGYLIIENDKLELKTIATINENENQFNNRKIIEKTKITAKPLLISRNNDKRGSDYLGIETTACLCIPITNSVFQNYSDNLNSNIIGYLYLESDRIIHNINEEGLQQCSEFLNLLALLIEKHQLKIDASIDKLTGTLTRKYLEETINLTILESDKNKSVFSIIMYDLDNFKNINDRFGHQKGDEVLASISKIVIDNLGKEDFIGRYGGEEFMIILPNKNSDEALLFADDLRKKIYSAKILGNKADITVSMGIASYPVHGQSMDELFEKVDQALYISKETGKNRCTVWDNKYSSNKPKTKDKLTGIISGNSIQDSRNILAIVELIQLSNKNISTENKIYQFLGRTIEIIEATYGYLFIIDNDKVVNKFGRKSQKEDWAKKIIVNERILNSVIQNKQGTYLIDWDDIGKSDLIAGIPDWNSIIINPILVKNEVKAVLYYSISTRIKEFGDNEFNFINVLSDLVPAILT